MPLSESDTRAKLIDPALHASGWTEDLLRREETAGAIDIVSGKARRQTKGRVDYLLRVKVTSEAQPLALALIEAKAEHLPPNHGLEQAKLYAACKRLHVPFVFATNGHLYVEFDQFTGLTSQPRLMGEFPSPADLRLRYEQGMGFKLDEPSARPLLVRYQGGEATRRYYQDAAIRAVLEKIVRCQKAGQPPRALLSLATGAGKTFIAVNLLRRIAGAGQLRRALFLCDRDELRSQALSAFQNAFGADAAEVSGGNPQKNARILIATYQTLDVDTDQADANFLTTHYPENYFSHIIIDECHRSAWGKWSQVLKRNPDAVQVGLTATPRHLVGVDLSAYPEDQHITADNLAFFGEPVYEYDMSQGIQDGYLAACEIIRQDIFLDNKPDNERITGLDKADLQGKVIRDGITGQIYQVNEIQAHYEAANFEDEILLPDRVQAMCADLFNLLLASGGPEQKTIIFCTRDSHADRVAVEMNNLYAAWCRNLGRRPAAFYAFKCTAASSGNDYLADLRGASRHHFIAATVDLLSTGVDVPIVQNIVFFKYVRSPIAFYQMVGRGTRIYPPTGKLMFRVYDYTDATRLFGEAFLTRAPVYSDVKDSLPVDRDQLAPDEASSLQVEGFTIQVTPAGRCILTMVDGKAMPVSVEEYKQHLAERLVAEAPTLDDFRLCWVQPQQRQALMAALPDGGRAPALVRTLENMNEYDLYDVMAELGYGMAPRTRQERAAAFAYKHAQWLAGLPGAASATLRALAEQFAVAGTDALENPLVFSTPTIQHAGGIEGLKKLGKPSAVLQETKQRIFAA
jgi:type I restriction enzyme, R subunit